ncbi:MAG TPA: hypothetical protein VIK89_02420 [Cytophagaceae bacterium]
MKTDKDCAEQFFIAQHILRNLALWQEVFAKPYLNLMNYSVGGIYELRENEAEWTAEIYSA